MHMRTKKWAKPELAVCPYFTDEAVRLRGRWRSCFQKEQPLHLELGCGKGVSTAAMVYDNRDVNYIAMDIKSSPEGYARAVGVDGIDVTPAMQSVKLIMDSGIDYEFRTTAVKGLHIVSDFEKIGDWIAGARKYFIQQFIDSGDLIQSGFSAFDTAETEKLLAAVRKNVPNAESRGI